MQKLSLKLKNIPTDTSLACSYTNSLLNKEKTLSLENKVLDDNNLEVNLPQRKEGFDLRVQNIVYVFSMLTSGTHYKGKKVNGKSINIKKIEWSFNYGSFIY